MREDGIVYWQTCYRDRSAGIPRNCTEATAVKAINGDW